MNRKRKNFTLVELLVSLGVFSILLLIFMQLFNGLRLAWTNTERKIEAQYSSSLCMGILSDLLGSISCVNVDETVGGVAKKVPFPFYLARVSGSSDSNCNLYFASKAKMDLLGSNPIRFVGVLYPHAAKDLGLTSDSDLHKVYLTVISNASTDAAGNDISSDNRDIYHKFWPAPDFDGYNDSEDARKGLQTELDKKVKLSTQRVVLFENVTEFKVKLYKADGTEVNDTADKVSELPDSLEVTVSALNPADFKIWKGLTGTAKEDFQRDKQSTFSRRIYIGDRWSVGGDYGKY